MFSRRLVLKNVPSKLLINAYKTISSWKNYNATPLLSLDKLEKHLNINKIFYKDESRRFHLKSFKALGGAYAVERISKGKKNITISSATAGNHGKSVAWGTKRLGLKCKIFVSQYVSSSRVKEIKKFGADVIRVKGDYENSLNECKKLSKKNNWKIVQDVATRDYKLVPQLTMGGYSIMIREISKQTNQYITHIFLQAGVGGMAAGVVAGVAKYFKRIPKIIEFLLSFLSFNIATVLATFRSLTDTQQLLTFFNICQGIYDISLHDIPPMILSFLILIFLSLLFLIL